MDIKISDYRLIQPEKVELKKLETPIEMVDISLEDNNTFYIVQDNGYLILSHNCDGDHISSLILNMLYKWFPHIIKQGRVFKLQTPVVVAKRGSKTVRYYTYGEFKKNMKGLTNIEYMKGLGALSIPDWDYVFGNLKLSQYIADENTTESLNIAFGDDVNLRKQWLTGA